MPVLENTLEIFFSEFRRKVIGDKQVFESPFGPKEIVYADWTASGRAYRPIEECMQSKIMPFLANTHTETTVTGTSMSKAYEEAKVIVKQHVHANEEDVLVFCGSGMTGAVNKLQRILGLRAPGRFMKYLKAEDLQEEAPVVFVTHMEHHSNQISWLETIATVEIIPAGENGNVDLGCFRSLLERYRHCENKIAAVSACSNVTGIQTPYHSIAKIIHEYGGSCFVDFASSAPYVDIDMHPEEEGADLDAIYFSPHKFLGGPGTPGVLIFHKRLCQHPVPDQPGGGTVLYSNPWGLQEYVANTEQREDGGTPPILGGIRVAMCVRLKEAMGVENMRKREEEMRRLIFHRFSRMENVKLLEGNVKKRAGIFSFIVGGAHYNLVVKMLNDRFGIQTRGGCSCAGTYGHYLLQVDEPKSYKILDAIRSGNLSHKPGWVRLSIHPIMTDAEIGFIMDGIELVALHYQEWADEYQYDPGCNEFFFSGWKERDRIGGWFRVSDWG